MANNCSFDLKVTGEETAVKEFIKKLEFDPDYGYSHFGWVYSFEVQDWMTERDAEKPGLLSMGGVGDCPYSIKYAMRDEKQYESLESVSKRSGLVIEAFSSEPGNGIQEHFLVNHGKVLVDECKDDYREYVIDGATEAYIHEVAEENDLSEEELFSKVNVNGEFCVGGFENYADFENHFSYFQPELVANAQKPSLDKQIQSASSRVSEQRPDTVSKEKNPTERWRV